MDNFASTEVINLKTKNGSNLPMSNTYFDLVPQSAQTTSAVHASSSMQQYVEESPSRTLAIDQGHSSAADITSFLQRKVQIHTQNWSVGAAFTASIYPWDLFLNNPAVLKKIANYALVKGDLMLTILINGTPFHAGMLLASYAYMDETNELITIAGDTQFITRSQRPHLFLNASTCKGGCLCAPFFWPYNYFNLVNGEHAATEIGRLDIGSFADLVQINAGTDEVTITVFAQMINPILTAPTMALVALSGQSTLDFSDYFTLESQADEYKDNGVISGPSSALATYAGLLAQVPIIRPFALATQIGATAVGSIARLFGYSRPTVVSDLATMRNYPISSLALTEGADTSQKLTITGKQEISIDPTLCGLPSEDTMTIACMAQRESYLTQFTWDVSDNVSDVIFACTVDPMAERRTAGTDQVQMIPTSLSFATRAFTAWSGTLKYRFQVVASQYHRGRIAIVYDPYGPLTGDPYNVTFNTIIDLAEGRDFTVKIPWQQDRPYCDVVSTGVPTFYTESNPGFLSGSQYSNGVFFVRVVNELVVPDGVTPVKILVSISADEDYEVMNPANNLDQFMLFEEAAESDLDFGGYFSLETQSSTEVVPDDENAPEGSANVIDLIPNVVGMIDQKPLIFYGERVLSFRQMLKRYTHQRVYTFAASTKNYLFDMTFRAMPTDRGLNPDGPDTTLLALSYNYAGMSYICYLKRAYAGWRGSIRWKLLSNRPTKVTSVVRMTGLTNASTALGSPHVENIDTNIAQSILAYRFLQSYRGTSGGTALTMNNTQEGCEVEVPFAVPFRFCKTTSSTAASSAYSAFSPGGDAVKLLAVTSNGTGATLYQTMVAAGEDFTFLGWIGAPVIYYMGVDPVPS